MTTTASVKKKVVKPSNKKSIAKIENANNESKSETTVKQEPVKEYKPVFPTMIIKQQTRQDLNYVEIGRRIRRVLAEKKERILHKDNNNENINKSHPDNIVYQGKEYSRSLWGKYCLWFNSVFNKSEKKPEDKEFTVKVEEGSLLHMFQKYEYEQNKEINNNDKK